MNTLLFLITFSCSVAAGEAGEASSVEFRIPENSPAGTVVGTVAASMSDARGNLRFTITAGNAEGAFAIDAETGRITVEDSKPLDFEAKAGFDLTVQVKDVAVKPGDDLRNSFAARLLKSGVDPQAVRQLLKHAKLRVAVKLDDVNEPPRLGNRAFRLAENGTGGTVLGSIGASDPDAGDTLSYAITAGNTGGAFVVDSETGRITIREGAALDFETAPHFELTLEATDAAGASGTAICTVDLDNVNESPVVADRSFRIDEGSSHGTELGVVTAVDPDAEEALRFAIVGGNTGDAFAIDAETGRITVNDDSPLDFRTNPRFELTVQATDSAGMNGTAVVTVDLGEVEKAPAVVALPPGAAEQGATTVAVPLSQSAIRFSDSSVQDAIAAFIAAFIASVSGRGDVSVALAIVCLMWYATSGRTRSKSRRLHEPNERQAEHALLQERIGDLEKEIGRLQTENHEQTVALDDQRGEIALERATLAAEQSRLQDETEALRIQRELFEDQQMRAIDSTPVEDESVDLFEVDADPEPGETLSAWMQTKDVEDPGPAPEPVSAAEDQPEECSQDGAMDESIADYMRNLLGRSRSSVDEPANRPSSGGSAGASTATVSRAAVLETESLLSGTSTQNEDKPFEQQTEIESAEIPPEPTPVRKPVDKQAVRNDIDSLRQIANLTARTAINKHSRAKLKKRVLVAGTLTAISLATAGVLLNGQFWGITSPRSHGWAAAALAGFALLELFRSYLQNKRRDPSASAKD